MEWLTAYFIKPGFYKTRWLVIVPDIPFLSGSNDFLDFSITGLQCVFVWGTFIPFSWSVTCKFDYLRVKALQVSRQFLEGQWYKNWLIIIFRLLILNKSLQVFKQKLYWQQNTLFSNVKLTCVGSAKKVSWNDKACYIIKSATGNSTVCPR